VYIYEMEVHQVPGTTMMETFGLAVVPEIRVRVHEIHGQVTSWGRFEKWLRNEYFDEDTKRVTKKATKGSFLDWVEQQPKKLMGPNGRLHERPILFSVTH
jgi:hypothetical protein